MEQDIKFCGNAFVNPENGMIKISLNLNQLQEFLAENKAAVDGGKEESPAIYRSKTNVYVKLAAFQLKTPKDYATHFVKIDEWKPDPNYRKEDTEYSKKGYNWTQDEKPVQKPAQEIKDTDLPF